MIKLWNNEAVNWQLNFVVQTEDNEQGKFLELTVNCSPEGGQVLTVGLGKQEELTKITAKRAVAQGVRELEKLSVTEAVVKMDQLETLLGQDTLAVVVEAAFLALYKRKNWKSKTPDKDCVLYLEATGKTDRDRAFTNAMEVVQAIAQARDLVNEPGNKLSPGGMAERMVEQASSLGLHAKVLDMAEMRELGMGALLAVGESSGNEPKLIVLTHKGNPESTETLALVGKGVTFDTGGYNLKPSASMSGMYSDMAGAAAVFGAISLVAQNKLKLNVIAVIPAVENRISPTSFLPGDVLTSMSGKTIEIGNTDAEGRLILADAITYAIEKQGATRIVDIATLTGAVVSMLGHTTAGLMTNQDEFYNLFMEAAQASGEQYWRLPAFPEYRKMIESNVADIHNMSNDGCGTIAAGLFIEAFAQDKPWIHLDIAGTAFVDRPRTEFQTKGGTGAGVASLYHLCRLMAETN